jgi:hypothetical protein
MWKAEGERKGRQKEGGGEVRKNQEGALGPPIYNGFQKLCMVATCTYTHTVREPQRTTAGFMIIAKQSNIGGT